MIFTLTLNPAVDRELTVPAIEFDSVLRATKSHVDFGGKGFNVSRLLRSLGIDSTAVGFLGGKAGEILRDGLNALTVRTEFVWVPEETLTNISIVTSEGHHYIKVNEKGPTITLDKQQELLAKIEGLAFSGDCWVLAGSLPPGIAPSFYAQVINILNRRGAVAVLDTSGESLKLGCQEKPYLVKPNTDEARALTGLSLNTTEEIARAAIQIRKLGAQNVIISMGKAGALLQTEHGDTWFVHSPEVMERNPIGAGDSMVGGLVWAITRGLSLLESLGWGVASGAATASLSGTEVGSQPLIDALKLQVRYEPLNIPG